MRVGRIYKIIVGESNDCYVGSTFQPLQFRFRDHKNHYNQWKQGKSQYASVYDLFQTFGVENCRMIQVREYEVLDRRHLEVYETLWIKKLKAKNKVEPCAGILKKERIKKYREDKRELINAKAREYYEANKTKINEQQKQKRGEMKERIQEKSRKYYETNKEFVKKRVHQYYKEHKEQVKEQKMQYYQTNREHIRKSRNQKASEQIQCEICGITIRRSSMPKHLKSKNHQSKLCLE